MGWPLRNPVQTTFAGGPGPFGAGDCILVPAAFEGAMIFDDDTQYLTAML